jgi:Tfp pilus assembly protein PilX
MKDPHNYKKVGYSMIVVAASLAIIGLIGLAIGHDVLFGDRIQRVKTEQFNECQANEMVGEDCEKYARMLDEMERSPIP